MALAGLWDSFKWPTGDITPSYCIITTAANSLVVPIHNRMPVILEEEDWPVWLGEQPGRSASAPSPACGGPAGMSARPRDGKDGEG